MTPPQNPQHVVLIRRQIGGGLEKPFPGVEDSCRRDPQTKQDLLLAGVEFALLFEGVRNRSGHGAADIIRYNDYRQEDYFCPAAAQVTDPRMVSDGARVM